MPAPEVSNYVSRVLTSSTGVTLAVLLDNALLTRQFEHLLIFYAPYLGIHPFPLEHQWDTEQKTVFRMMLSKFLVKLAFYAEESFAGDIRSLSITPNKLSAIERICQGIVQKGSLVTSLVKTCGVLLEKDVSYISEIFIQSMTDKLEDLIISLQENSSATHSHDAIQAYENTACGEDLEIEKRFEEVELNSALALNMVRLRIEELEKKFTKTNNARQAPAGFSQQEFDEESMEEEVTLIRRKHHQSRRSRHYCVNNEQGGQSASAFEEEWVGAESRQHISSRKVRISPAKNMDTVVSRNLTPHFTPRVEHTAVQTEPVIALSSSVLAQQNHPRDHQIAYTESVLEESTTGMGNPSQISQQIIIPENNAYSQHLSSTEIDKENNDENSEVRAVSRTPEAIRKFPSPSRGGHSTQFQRAQVAPVVVGSDLHLVRQNHMVLRRTVEFMPMFSTPYATPHSNQTLSCLPVSVQHNSSPLNEITARTQNNSNTPAFNVQVNSPVAKPNVHNAGSRQGCETPKVFLPTYQYEKIRKERVGFKRSIQDLQEKVAHLAPYKGISEKAESDLNELESTLRNAESLTSEYKNLYQDCLDDNKKIRDLLVRMESSYNAVFETLEKAAAENAVLKGKVGKAKQQKVLRTALRENGYILPPSQQNFSSPLTNREKMTLRVPSSI